MSESQTTTERVGRDPTRPITFEITAKHIKLAKQCDQSGCVVALALLDHVGDLFEEVLVGSTVTKIVTKLEVLRYRTPAKLRTAIPIFDRTGSWELPPGKYTLGVYKPSGTGGKDKTGTLTGKSKFAGRSIPVRTRHVTRKDVLCSIDNKGK